MCGIVYCKNLKGKPVKKTVAKRYLAQRSRGHDGFGFYTPEDNRLTHNAKEGRILSLLRRSKASEILFHHRYPTSTSNVRNACHPFSTKDYFDHNYIVVHNGVLYNEDDLKKEHEESGIKYVSEQEDGRFNDSEALTYDIARYLEGEVNELKAQGSIAFIATQMKDGKPVALYFGRNGGNPLKATRTKDSILLSSEGSGQMIKENTLYKYDYETGTTTERYMKIPMHTSYGYNGQSNWWNNRHNRYRNYDDLNWEEDLEDDFRIINHRIHTRKGESPDEIRVFFEEEKKRDETITAWWRKKFLGEAYESPTFAIEWARERLNEVTERMDEIDAKIESSTFTEAEEDEYFTLQTQKYYMGQALKSLELEVSGQNRIGFRASGETAF